MHGRFFRFSIYVRNGSETTSVLTFVPVKSLALVGASTVEETLASVGVIVQTKAFASVGSFEFAEAFAVVTMIGLVVGMSG